MSNHTYDADNYYYDYDFYDDNNDNHNYNDYAYNNDNRLSFIFSYLTRMTIVGRHSVLLVNLLTPRL